MIVIDMGDVHRLEIEEIQLGLYPLMGWRLYAGIHLIADGAISMDRPIGGREDLISMVLQDVLMADIPEEVETAILAE